MDRTVPPKNCLRLQCRAQVVVTRYQKEKLSVMLLHTCSAHAVVWFVRFCERLVTPNLISHLGQRKKIISRTDLMRAMQATKFIDVPGVLANDLTIYPWVGPVPVHCILNVLRTEHSYTMAKLQLYHWIPEAKVRAPVSVTFYTFHHSFVSKLNILLSVSKVFSKSFVRCIIRAAHRQQLV